MSRRRFLRTAGAIGVTAAAFGVVAACGGGATAAPSLTAAPSSAPTAGKIGGKLRYVGWEGEDGAPTEKLTKWRKDNNIDLSYTYVSSPDETLSKIRTDSGGVDITTTHVEIYERVRDLLEPFDLSRLANYETLWPALKAKRWVFPDGNHYAIPALWGDAPTIYDPAKWDGPPDRYMELADAKYKNAIASPDDVFMNYWAVSRSLGHTQPMVLTQKQLDEVRDAWKKIKPNIVALTPDSLSSIVDLMVRGDASIAPFGGWEPMVTMAAEKGKELKFGTPKVDSCFWWVDNYAIPKASQNKDTAYAYIDQLISPEGNAEIANYSGSGCTQSKSYDLLDAKVQGWYPWDAVKVTNPPDDSPVLMSLTPPKEDAGEIVGVDAWLRSWQEAKLG